jgi:riboflavin kinase / FMN adenylyltransferase
MVPLFRDAGGPVLCPRGSIVCIGAFDGVHRGHRALLARVRERATATGCAAAAVSFEPLPRQFFQGRDQITRLTSPRQRIGLLSGLVDVLGMLRFNAALAAMSAEDFVLHVLAHRLRAREVWVGPQFRFGHARRGDIALLRTLGERHGFAAHEIEPVTSGGERVSSSRIRAHLDAGDFATASVLLDRPYAIEGHVVHGAHLGRKLGYPTANMRLPWGRAPVHGIFAVRVSGAGLDRWPAVASLGTRPTVDGVEPLLESHLFDFDGDLYGRVLSVEFVQKLRDEARFESLDTLVEQIHRDAHDARAILSQAADAAPVN